MIQTINITASTFKIPPIDSIKEVTTIFILLFEDNNLRALNTQRTRSTLTNLRLVDVRNISRPDITKTIKSIIFHESQKYVF